MMIYGAFASMVGKRDKKKYFGRKILERKRQVLRHPMWWLPWSGLALVWTCLFYPSWLAKDASMARYPEWPHYTAVSGP